MEVEAVDFSRFRFCFHRKRSPSSFRFHIPALNSITYNFYGLIHLVHDVREYDPLDKFFCFLFENYLRHSKKWVGRIKKFSGSTAHRLREGFNLNDSRQDYNYISKFKSSPEIFAIEIFHAIVKLSART